MTYLAFKSLHIAGVVLFLGNIIITGVWKVLVWTGRLDPVHTTWLLWGQGLFIASGLIWVAILIPVQIAQARMARGFAGGEAIPERYWRLGRHGRSGVPSPHCSRSPIFISWCSSRRKTGRGKYPNKGGPSHRALLPTLRRWGRCRPECCSLQNRAAGFCALDAKKKALTERIRAYQPLAIVSIMRSIGDIVNEAAVAAGSAAPRYVVPFPGNGQQRRFLDAMARIVPALPRA